MAPSSIETLGGGVMRLTGNLVVGAVVVSISSWAVAQSVSPTCSSPAAASPAAPLWYGIVSSGPNPSQPIIQIGPFQDKAACDVAVAAADKRNVIEFGICVADRS